MNTTLLKNVFWVCVCVLPAAYSDEWRVEVIAFLQPQPEPLFPADILPMTKLIASKAAYNIKQLEYLPSPTILDVQEENTLEGDSNSALHTHGADQSVQDSGVHTNVEDQDGLDSKVVEASCPNLGQACAVSGDFSMPTDCSQAHCSASLMHAEKSLDSNSDQEALSKKLPDEKTEALLQKLSHNGYHPTFERYVISDMRSKQPFYMRVSCEPSDCVLRGTFEFSKDKNWKAHGALLTFWPTEEHDAHVSTLVVNAFLTEGRWRYIDHPTFGLLLRVLKA